MFTPQLLYIVLAVLGSLCIYKFRSAKHGLLPPGPKGLPLLGNLFDMPSQKEWLTFAKWAETWGNTVSISVFGRLIVIINDLDVATEILDSKSIITSGRPIIPLCELVGSNNALPLLSYGPRFRTFRKLSHQVIGTPSALKPLYRKEEHEALRFLRRLLHSPEDLATHIRNSTGATILSVLYGYEVVEGEDAFVILANRTMEQFSQCTAPGGFLVNLIPPLAAIPEWFPGGSFKKLAKEWSRTIDEMVNRPYQFVKDQISAGTAEKSFVSTLLDSPVTPEEENDIKWTALSLHAGGSDTTFASKYSFFLAMMLFPEVQKKAQLEIDTVIGRNRLPTIEDRDRLPYLNALVLEVLRWHTVVPNSLPHMTTEDLIYEGFMIPKDTLIIANLWKMLHDPQTYKDPMLFNPDRFLASKDHTPERDPRHACYGFGRRICPGRLLADSAIFISCAMTLAVFNISKRVENGKVVEPVVDQTSGTVSHPIPFSCSVVPRSDEAKTLILSYFEGKPLVISDSIYV